MRIFSRFTGRRVEKRGLMVFFCLILLSVFAQAAALAQQPAPLKFEATGLDKPAQDITLAGTVPEERSRGSSGDHGRAGDRCLDMH